MFILIVLNMYTHKIRYMFLIIIALIQLQWQTNLLVKYKQNHRPIKFELIILIRHGQGWCFAEIKSALAVCMPHGF